MDFDVQAGPAEFDPHFGAPVRNASATLAQIWLWTATFSTRSVFTSIKNEPLPVKERLACSSNSPVVAGQEYWRPYIAAAGRKSRPCGVPKSSSKFSA